MRNAFLNRVSLMIKNEPDTVFITVDIGMHVIKDVLRDYPGRCFNTGIFEDGLISMAGGMAKMGLVPTIYGIQPYLIDRSLEQIKLDLAYSNVGVNIVGTGGAVDYSKYGYSHYCPEDIGLIKQLPGCQFVAPGTAKEFATLFEQSYRNGKPTFFRISDHPNKYEADVEFGKCAVVRIGGGPIVISVSTMLDATIEACQGYDTTILYYSTLEPFDSETLKRMMYGSKILIVEPHFKGALLHDIIEALPGQSLQIEDIGFPREIFRNYGTYYDKMEYYGLTIEGIRTALKRLI